MTSDTQRTMQSVPHRYQKSAQPNTCAVCAMVAQSRQHKTAALPELEKRYLDGDR